MCWSLDDAPSFTLYRMRFTDATGADRDLVGVIGGLEVVDEGAGGVLPHERTTPKASTDRLDLTRATECQPVAGLGPVARRRADRPAHRAGRADRRRSPSTASSTSSSGSPTPSGSPPSASTSARDDVLIADGHHRYGISPHLPRRGARRRPGASDTPAEQTLAFVGELVAEQLSIEAIHRLYAGAPFDDAARRARRARSTWRPPAGRRRRRWPQMARPRAASCLVGPDGIGRVADPPARRVRRRPRRSTARGSSTPSADSRGRRHLPARPRRGRSPRSAPGAATAAVLIRPVSIAEIERTAREGLLMPPKSTFFTPKLRTGLVIRA